MSRTLLVLLTLALVASPAVGQHGPPPGYTDPVAYAQDYADRQAADASADPVAYAQGKDAAAEAEHALWLSCWTAYEAAGRALDAVCAPFFTAPVNVEPDAQAIEAEVTEVLNATGVSALGDEVLDAVQDTIEDPASAVEQGLRIARAIVRFVLDLVDFITDTIGLAVLALAAGLLGAVLGLIDLAAVAFDGLAVASNGIAGLTGAVAAMLALAGSGLATAASALGDGLLDGAAATFGVIRDAGAAAAHSATATVVAVGAGLTAAVSGVDDAAAALTSTIAEAAGSLREAVADAVRKVGSLFDGSSGDTGSHHPGLPDAPKTGTDADGLLERLRGVL